MSFLNNLAIKLTSVFKILANNDFSLVTDTPDGGGGSYVGKTAQSSDVAAQVTSILQTWIGPLFTVIGALGSIYIIILAVQYAKSENDSKRAEIKSRIVNLCIGVVSLLVIGTLCLAIDWQSFANIFGYASN